MRTADMSSPGERTAAGSRAGARLSEAAGTEAAGTEVIGGAPVVVVGASAMEAVGRPEDIVDPEQPDTKLVCARVLPGLGLRLYGRKEGRRGCWLGRRRLGVVVARGMRSKERWQLGQEV